jgi:hypothetical protein
MATSPLIIAARSADRSRGESSRPSTSSRSASGSASRSGRLASTRFVTRVITIASSSEDAMLKYQLLTGETYAFGSMIRAASVVMPAKMASFGVGTGLAS